MKATIITAAFIAVLFAGHAAIDAAPSWALSIAGPVAAIAILIGTGKLLATIIREARRG